jgi:MHS family proline/betaine transporter-like MFS transporter
MTFLEKTCSIEFVQTRNIIAIALMIGTPLFIYFGWLSDKLGRKLIMMSGMVLAVILYRPIYKHMYAITDISQKTEIVEKRQTSQSSDKNKQGGVVSIQKEVKVYDDGTTLTQTTREEAGKKPDVKKEVTLSGTLFQGMIGMVLIQVVLVTMVYGPIAAFLVEIFPTRIRYTSMSLPYHIGNGVFGGLTPFIATYLYEQSKSPEHPNGDPFAGLWYPISIAAITVVIGMIFLSNRKKAEVMED